MPRLLLGFSIMVAVLLLSAGAATALGPGDDSDPGSVIVEWTTESEVNLAGFNLYRSEGPDGPYVKVNDTLIPASPDPVTGGSYSYVDTTVVPGMTYYYKLEDVELDGKATLHGPIVVTGKGTDAPHWLQPGVVLGIALAATAAAAGVILAFRCQRFGQVRGGPGSDT